MTYLMNDKISALEGEEFQRKKIHKRPNPLHMNVYHFNRSNCQSGGRTKK